LPATLDLLFFGELEEGESKASLAEGLFSLNFDFVDEIGPEAVLRPVPTALIELFDGV